MAVAELVNATPLTVKPLSTFQRIIYAVAGYGIGSAAAVVEGPLIFYYSDELGVSTQYLAIVNFIVGVTTIFASLLIGGISDRSKARYRRKPYIFVLMFFSTAGLFFRFGAFTSKEAAPFYYAVSMFCQKCGDVALGVVQGAWAVELANEGADRANLFAVCGIIGVIGIFFGLGLSAAPLVLGGCFLAFCTILFNSLCLWFIEEKTPLSKRSFIPTVTNLRSVFYNTQFVIYISAMVFIFFINTIPGLYLFFLTYVMDQGEDSATLLFLLSVGGFVLMGFVAMPMAPHLISKYGKLVVADYSLRMMAVCGVLMFIASFVHPAMVVAVFSVVGFNSALAGTVFSIIQADTIDYDELLTGMKRGASYGGISGPTNTFITIAGLSIPLALMSAFKFEAPDPDADDLSDDRAQDGYSSSGSTGVLRVYCTLFIAVCSLISMSILKMYKIDNKVHDEILASIYKRNIATVSESGGIDDFDSGVSTTRDSIISEQDEMPVIKADVNLASVINPVTGLNVVPAPYITVEQTISKVLENKSAFAPQLVDLDELMSNDLRLLGYYFPAMLNLCIQNEDINMLLVNGYVRFVFFLVVSIAGVWHCIQALIEEKEFQTYLIVVLTTFYFFFLIWEILHFKGYKLLRRMMANPDRPLQNYLEVVYTELEGLDKAVAADNGDKPSGDTLLIKDHVPLYSTPMRNVTKGSGITMAVVLTSLAFAVLAIQLS